MDILNKEMSGSVCSSPLVEGQPATPEEHPEDRASALHSFIIVDNPEDMKPRVANFLSLRGPRRLVRMLICGVVLPLLLLTTTLYARLVLYTPQTLPMAPTDQRLVNQKVSSVWCQGQKVSMNGSFDAFMLSQQPRLRPNKTMYNIEKTLRLRDDVKEYWGFFLQKGSKVTLGACSRYEGGQLMILKGTKNLKKCAWIGEDDSSEDLEELMEDLHKSFETSIATTYNETDPFSELMKAIVRKGIPPEKSEIETTSVERIQNIDFLIKKALKLSKNKFEILASLYKHAHVAHDTRNQTTEDKKSIPIEKEFNHRNSSENAYKLPRSMPLRTHLEEITSLSQLLHLNISESSAEDLVHYMEDNELFSDQEGFRNDRAVETDEWDEVDGGENLSLDYERGALNQTNEGDESNEENVSSYSSSEEALASCNGVIMTLPITPSLECIPKAGENTNTVSYDVAETGTYYFVFSSDNEIVENFLSFNIVLERVVFDTSDAETKCLNSTNCSLPMSFLSQSQAVVEVSQSNSWDESYVLHVKCEPRVSIYFFLILLVPIFVLCCASR